MINNLVEQPRLMPCLILMVCLAALGTALTSELYGGLKPCVLCIYQRYAYGAALAVGLVGLVLGGSPALRSTIVALAGLCFLGGAAIAGFHVGVEQGWWQGTAECHAPVFDPNLSIDELRKQLLNTDFVACDEIAWQKFGISMAGYNALFSCLVGLLCLAVAFEISRLRKA